MKAKFWHKMTFWQFVKYVITPFLLVGEGAILMFNGEPQWHAVIFVAAVISAFMKAYIKDDDGDGIADTFQ